MLGQVISHYEIRRMLGQGGMGTVYEAVDTRLGRHVALKFLTPALVSSPAARARFEREARAASSLSHPNIAVLYSFEESADETFLCFEYLSGGTLQDRLNELAERGEWPPLPQGLAWVSQIATGLAHAHSKGVVHRDVKPANVMFDERGQLKITDFGLAKLHGGSRLTGEGSAMGTPAYMAPEQAVGSGEADRRADIFSLGVMLYEMVSGELPFQADTQIGTLHKVLNETPAPATRHRADAPPALERIITRCLQKKPERRYQRMEELAADLERLGSHSKHSAPAPPDSPATVTIGALNTSELPPPASGRRKRWTIAGAAAILALLAVLFGGLRDRFAGGDTPERRKLAVLLFDSIGGDPSQEAFCDGLTYSLTSAITRFEHAGQPFWVVPASEIRDEDVHSARDARKAFGVNLALSGRVQRSPENVRVTVNLVDAAESRQLDSRTIDAEISQLPELETRVLRAVGEMLQLEAGGARVRTVAETGDAGAYDHCLRGRGYLRRLDRPGNLDRAIAAFRNALDSDPNYALALTGLGEAYLAKFARTREAQWLTKAQEDNRRAIALDSSLAPAYINLSILYARTGRFQDAVREARTALDLDPLSANAYRTLANAHAHAGQLDDAEETFRQAISLRPDFWLAYSDLGVFYVNHNRFEDAVPPFEKVVELTPDNDTGYRNLAAVNQMLGRYDDAEKLLDRAVEINPSAETLSNLGTLYFSQQRFPEAVRSYERAVTLSPEDPIIRGNLADAYRMTPKFRDQAPASYRAAATIAKRQLAINPKNPELLLGLAICLARTGDSAGALRSLEKARSLVESNVQLSFQSAIVYELSGQRNRAISALRDAVNAGYPLAEVARDPDLAGLSQEPGYQALLKLETARIK